MTLDITQARRLAEEACRRAIDASATYCGSGKQGDFYLYARTRVPALCDALTAALDEIEAARGRTCGTCKHHLKNKNYDFCDWDATDWSCADWEAKED